MMLSTDRLLRRLSSALAKHPGTTNAQIAALAARQFDLLGYSARDVLDAHHLGQAEGASLDRIVALLALQRAPTETDDQLRDRFYIELSRRQVSGTRADIIAAIAAISDWELGTDYLLLEPPNVPAPSQDQGAFCIDFLFERDDLDPETQSALGTILQASKPAGVLPVLRHHRTLPAAAIGAGMFSSAMLDLSPAPSEYPDLLLAMDGSTSALAPTTDEVVGFESISGWTFESIYTSPDNANSSHGFVSTLSADSTHVLVGSSAARIYNAATSDPWDHPGAGFGRLYKSVDMSDWGYLRASFYMARVNFETYWIAPWSASFVCLIDGSAVHTLSLASGSSYCYENEWFDFSTDVRAYSGSHTLEFRFYTSSTYDRNNGEALWIDDVAATVPAT